MGGHSFPSSSLPLPTRGDPDGAGWSRHHRQVGAHEPNRSGSPSTTSTTSGGRSLTTEPLRDGVPHSWSRAHLRPRCTYPKIACCAAPSISSARVFLRRHAALVLP